MPSAPIASTSTQSQRRPQAHAPSLTQQSDASSMSLPSNPQQSQPTTSPGNSSRRQTDTSASSARENTPGRIGRGPGQKHNKRDIDTRLEDADIETQPSNNDPMQLLLARKSKFDEESFKGLLYAFEMNLPSIPAIIRESEEVSLEDRCNKLENTIVRTIKNYEKLDFYKVYKSSRRGGRKIEVSTVPFGYYSTGKAPSPKTPFIPGSY